MADGKGYSRISHERSLLFQHLNLKGHWGFPVSLLDIIFRHNMFLYFFKDDRTNATALLLNKKSPGGSLFFGQAENSAIETSDAAVKRFKDTVGFQRNEEPVHVHVA